MAWGRQGPYSRNAPPQTRVDEPLPTPVHVHDIQKPFVLEQTGGRLVIFPFKVIDNVRQGSFSRSDVSVAIPTTLDTEVDEVIIGQVMDNAELVADFATKGEYQPERSDDDDN